MKCSKKLLVGVLMSAFAAQASSQAVNESATAADIPSHSPSASQEVQPSLASTQCQWPLWQSFKQHYVKEGRVIDDSDPRNITTSEGQSYGLFFALIANDQAMFEQMLTWTEQNLSGGDLTARLPAWLWGTLPNGGQGVLDANTASDSDLWIAYSLVEAGRLWNNYYYQTLGHLLAARILKEETTHVDNYGTVLLPGREGFVLGEQHVRLNPSYVPLQLLLRMQNLYPDYQWQALINSSDKLLLESMPEGFSPDWVEMTPLGLQTDEATESIGSYNAIRTYLWAGMLPDGSPYKKPLITKMQPLVELVKRTNVVPETVEVTTGRYKGEAGIGLTAATIPLLHAAGEQDLAQQLALQTQENISHIEQSRYYQSVLTLFALGWHQGRFQFDDTGKVTPNWVTACQE